MWPALCRPPAAPLQKTLSKTFPVDLVKIFSVDLGQKHCLYIAHKILFAIQFLNVKSNLSSLESSQQTF